MWNFWLSILIDYKAITGPKVFNTSSPISTPKPQKCSVNVKPPIYRSKM